MFKQTSIVDSCTFIPLSLYFNTFDTVYFIQPWNFVFLLFWNVVRQYTNYNKTTYDGNCMGIYKQD